jgi:phosphoribosylaminoimidazole carboxylase PurE protein
LTPFYNAFNHYKVPCLSGLELEMVTLSLHKEPIRAYEKVIGLIQKVPNSVILVYCGRSNGAGPTLSAQTSVPVITVPATGKDFPEDVWSSLRSPSETPVATILDPKNAVLSALQILAMHNPAIYAELRIRQEERLYNIVSL